MLNNFIITLTNVLVSIAFVIPGFLLCKAHKASSKHLSTMSAVLVYVCGPCMIIKSFLKLEFNWEDFGKMGLFFVASLLLQGLAVLTLFLILRKKYDIGKYRILTISSVMGNVGFFGLPLVQAVLADYPIAACYSSIYCITMNIICFTVGVFCLTGDKKYVSFKQALLNPTVIALFIAIPLYYFNVGNYLNDVRPEVISAVELLGKMTTPLCMLILGIRLGVVSFKKLFTRPFIYLTCILKMVVYPLLCYLIVYFIPGLDYAFKASVLVLSSVPCASVVFNLAEIYHSEEELSANTVLVSTLMCFITIPLVLLILGI